MGGYGMEENFELLEGYQFNLSDFALFLSVMKDPRAYRCVLSVFMSGSSINTLNTQRSAGISLRVKCVYGRAGH